MILFINTAEHNQAKLALIENESIVEHEFDTRAKLSESLIAQMEEFLQKNGKNVEDIKRIAVVRGPGSFVGSRTGVAFTNAFAWSRGIPALGLKAEEVPVDLKDLEKMEYGRQIITPAYGNPPNITTSNK